MEQLHTPVLLIAFNRPETTQRVFESIKVVKPLKLYYAIDGPRENNSLDQELTNACKKIIEQVDWPCNVHNLFRMDNRGCGRGPAEAISWAFENEEELIVLEDDCLPSSSFFTFCEQMLDKYREDERVNIISGRSHQQGSYFFSDYDYIFTHFAHTWGWATWKRVWKEYDILMTDYPIWVKNGGCKNIILNKKIANYLDKRYDYVYNRIKEEVTHSWDSQWSYTRIKTGGYGIVPCMNLIHNIGDGGTHTSTEDILLPGEMPHTIRHPHFVVANRDYDEYHFNNHICNSLIKYSIMNSVLNLCRVLKHKIHI